MLQKRLRKSRALHIYLWNYVYRAHHYLLSDTAKSIHQFVSVYANVPTAGQSEKCEDARGKMSAYRKAPA